MLLGNFFTDFLTFFSNGCIIYYFTCHNISKELRLKGKDRCKFMKPIKDTRLARLIGGKGAYITLAAVVLAAGGAGIAAYSKAVSTAENSFELNLSQSDYSSAQAADKTQEDVAKDVESEANESSEINDEESSDENAEVSLDTKTSPNVMPVNGEILSPFSNGELVKSETLGVWKTHDGVDIAADVGTPVKAMNKGEVTKVEEDPLWGYTVIIDHGSGIMGYYYNLSSSVAVEEGDIAEAGQTIGAVGDTAEIEAAMASHLHFGLKENGEWIDPVAYIDPLYAK